MNAIRNQMMRLLAVSALGSFSLGGASWVVLLSARGFSMLEIGVAEGVFHIASLILEVPSGALADVYGRKRAMMLSHAMFILSSLLMIASRGLPGVCLALVFSAAGYNFASGAREALAYDSLKAAGRQAHYLRYSSLEMIVYRVGSAAALLCAGLALAMGYRAAYAFDVLMAALCLLILLGVREAMPESHRRREPMLPALCRCFRESVVFLARERYARRLMLGNALLGAIATLLGFFLQARLHASGLAGAWIGPALFVMGLGGALGAKLTLRLAHWPLRALMLLCAAGTLLGLWLGAAGHAALMVVGGFIAAMCDDILQVRTDSRLNELFPSEQRATILSISSLLFSLIMIVLSPLFGWFFGRL